MHTHALLVIAIYALLVAGIVVLKPAFLFADGADGVVVLKTPGLAQDGSQSMMAAAVFFPLLAGIVYYLVAVLTLSRRG